MSFKINWASLIVGSKFNIIVLFYFVFEGNFPSTSPRGAYIWRRNLTEGFLCYRFEGFIFGGAYFRNFTVLYAWSPKLHNQGLETGFIQKITTIFEGLFRDHLHVPGI